MLAAMASSTNHTAHAADGTALAVTVTGAGPPLLMIPGLGSARRVYDPIVPFIAERCQVIVYDPRGIGMSGITDGPWDMHLLADDAVHVLDQVGVDRAAVFGASMGGMVAQQVAIDHPERVARLILAATHPGGVSMVRPDPHNLSRLMGRGATTPGDAYRIACTVLYGEVFRRQHPDFIERQVAERARHPVRARAFTNQAQAVAGHDAYQDLGGLHMPTLVMHGSLDQVSPEGNAHVLSGRIPGAQVLLFEDHGHLFFHEVPEESARVIADFVTSGS